MSRRSLSQVITVEKAVHSRNYEAIGELHKRVQKADQFAGISKTYERSDVAEAEIPPEVKLVQLRHDEVVASYIKQWSEWWDLEATKDTANCKATADVVVDGVVIVPNAPVTFLLFLEKQLSDVRKGIDVMPELPADKEWTFDDAKGIHKTEATRQARTQVKKRAIVLYDATDKHPAQTQLIDDQVITGYYTQVHYSGAIPGAEKRRILERVNKLIDAVKDARQRANQSPAEDVKIAANVFKFLFGAV